VFPEHASELDGRQCQVPRVRAGAVEHRGNFACATRAARSALTELGAWFDRQTYLGHGDALLAVEIEIVAFRLSGGEPTTCAHEMALEAAASITLGAGDIRGTHLAETTATV